MRVDHAVIMHATCTDSPIYFSDDMFLYEVKLIQCNPGPFHSEIINL